MVFYVSFISGSLQLPYLLQKLISFVTFYALWHERIGRKLRINVSNVDRIAEFQTVVLHDDPPFFHKVWKETAKFRE